MRIQVAAAVLTLFAGSDAFSRTPFVTDRRLVPKACSVPSFAGTGSSLSVTAEPANMSTSQEEFVRSYLVKAQEERVKAVEQAKKDTANEYEAKIAAMKGAGSYEKVSSMEAMRAELESAYTKEISSLTSQLKELQGENVAPLPAAGSGSVEQLHPAYAAKLSRAGWQSRWGPEEAVRVNTPTSAASVQGTTSATAGVNAGAGVPLSTNVPELQKQVEELQATMREYMAKSLEERNNLKAALAEAEGKVGPGSSGQSLEDYVKSLRDSYMAYMTRALAERNQAIAAAQAELRAAHQVELDELRKAGSGAEVGGIPSGPPGVEMNSAYQQKLNRPGWDSRWGPEEAARVAASGASGGAGAESGRIPSGPPGAAMNSAYQQKLSKAGWDSRWGPEEAARVAAAGASEGTSAGASAELAEMQDYLRAYMVKSNEDKARAVDSVKAELTGRISALEEELSTARASLSGANAK